ncbi:MAG: TonB-dependent receptor [Candidatus Aminicenantes bacterium]|nr:TonB-dependent receptor [Candidatus Aminicenantes bacterium]
MKRVSKILPVIIVIFFQNSLLFANNTLKGRVLSPAGLPVGQAEVTLINLGQSVLTDDQGQFSLEVPSPEKKLKFRIKHPDYFEQEFQVNRPPAGQAISFVLTPFIPQREEVVVTATRFPEPLTSVPAASSVVSSLTIEEKLPAHITDIVQEATGVASLGSGGFSIVPSIRGLARRRILLLVDGARLSSDRRTGPNASFLNPEDLARIEILRSPSSVYYGSDAIGGVINFLTYTPPAEDHFRVNGNLKYGTVNDEREVNLAFTGASKGLGYYFSLRNDQADNYRAPSGEVPLSYFTQSSLFGKVVKYSDRREISASFLMGRGNNIGKPAGNSDSRPTWYPRENQNLFQFNWKEKSFGPKAQLNFHFYINPYFLETRADRIQNSVKRQESFARTESTDFGWQLALEYHLRPQLRLNTGVDLYARARAQAYNQYLNFDSSGNLTETIDEYPYRGGRRTDAGLFATLDYSGLPGLDLVGGLRLDFLRSRAETGGEVLSTRNEALTGFVSASYQLFERVSLFANYSQAYRAPDLNEKYYTGITGRGFIIANPELKNESSQNFDAGLKITGRRLFVGLYGFSYSIDNLVERYLIDTDLYTYGNVDRGRIKGLELEWEFFPVSRLSFFGNGYLYEGQSRVSGNPLNDIPPARLIIGSRVWFSRFSLEVNGYLQAKQDEPGPAEIAIPGYGLLNLKTTYNLNRWFKLYFRVNNVLDKEYLARPDPDSRVEPGRNFLFGLSFAY